jgi:hypothetical protein
MEYVSPKFMSTTKRPVGSDKGKTVVINVKTADTAANIAKRRYVKWTVLRDLNPGVVKRANQTIRKGTKLRVPARKPSKGKGKS